MEKFIADGMLGKLARWMIIAGFDVIYVNKGGRQEPVKQAHRESRMLLTGDRALEYEKIFFIFDE